MVFFDLEKAYNRVRRDWSWWILDKRSIRRGYTDISKNIYKGAVMGMRITCGEVGESPMTICLQQGSALSAYLFALIMDG